MFFCFDKKQKILGWDNFEMEKHMGDGYIIFMGKVMMSKHVISKGEGGGGHIPRTAGMRRLTDSFTPNPSTSHQPQHFLVL